MTVAELIAALQKLPQDFPVFVWNDCYGYVDPEPSLVPVKAERDRVDVALPPDQPGAFDAITL